MKDPLTWSTEMLRRRGFSVTPVPTKGKRYLSLSVPPQLVATRRDGRCIIVVFASPAERFATLMALLNDKAARSLVFAVDADYSIEVHSWSRNLVGQPRAEVMVLDADDYCPEGQGLVLVGVLS
jgi:hypothetical protein